MATRMPRSRFCCCCCRCSCYPRKHSWNGKPSRPGALPRVWRLGPASLVRRSDLLRALCRPGLRRQRGPPTTKQNKAARCRCYRPLLRARACMLGQGVELSRDLRGCDRRFCEHQILPARHGWALPSPLAFRVRGRILSPPAQSMAAERAGLDPVSRWRRVARLHAR